MRGNDTKNRADKEEIFRYRLSKDPKLTEPNHHPINKFLDKYRDWYRSNQEALAGKQAA